jgi:hypothetical protein
MPMINAIHYKNTLLSKYIAHCMNPSDINEHLPTLNHYSRGCSHITECGVRSAVSSYAFAVALKGKPSNKLVQVDPVYSSNISVFQTECRNENVNTIFHAASDLDCPIETTELLFIDTWHVYGQLKRELSRWHNSVLKYIILHDTTVDEWEGETIRCNMDATQQSNITGIPISEINRGLWPAVEEFLIDNPNWILEDRFTNNNGLTILARVG